MAKFYGWRVVGAAFVLAFFGWGLGFYGPPVYLHAVREARGFSVTTVSAAVTLHYLAGALLAANVRVVASKSTQLLCAPPGPPTHTRATIAADLNRPTHLRAAIVH